MTGKVEPRSESDRRERMTLRLIEIEKNAHKSSRESMRKEIVAKVKAIPEGLYGDVIDDIIREIESVPA